MKASSILYPLLLSAYGVLGLYAQNIVEVPFGYVPRSLALSLCGAGFLLIVIFLVTRDWAKAGLISALAIILFFSYGRIYTIAKTWQIAGVVVGRHRLMLPLWGILWLVWTWWVTRRIAQPRLLTQFFTVFSVALIFFPIAGLVEHRLRTWAAAAQANKAAAQQEAGPERQSADDLPDIYYIVLDGYGRQDVLAELYDYDNSGFIDRLTSMGFYVSQESRANYNKTVWSLAATLNMKYINYLTEIVGIESRDRTRLIELIRQNNIQEFLRDRGYQTVGFNSGYEPVTMQGADILYALNESKQPFWSLNPFEGILVESTAVQAIIDLQPKESPRFQELQNQSYYAFHRDRILFTFDKLEQIALLEGNYFVFAHIVAPHPPFVFGSKGEKLTPKRAFSFNDGSHFEGSRTEYVDGYRDQLVYINQLVGRTIDEILARSDRPPIIILQGDHGPGAYLDWESAAGTNMKERLTILNAYYLPGSPCGELYAGITPVNSFRVVFNCQFDTAYPLPADESYYIRHSRPFDFLNVTEQIAGD